MKRFRSVLVLSAALLAVTCSRQPTSPSAVPGTGVNADAKGDPAPAAANTPLSATVQFGRPNSGSPFPPDPPHDQSAHAEDNLVPRTVVIKAGGTVTFQVAAAVHQIAIYDSGTEPEDIDTSVVTNLNTFAGCVGPPVVMAPLVINDSTNRIATYPVPCFTPATRTHTFNTPGRYLVICAFLPHFNVQMYGWVIVKE
jgi:plastocyanin